MHNNVIKGLAVTGILYLFEPDPLWTGNLRSSLQLWLRVVCGSTTNSSPADHGSTKFTVMMQEPYIVFHHLDGLFIYSASDSGVGVGKFN